MALTQKQEAFVIKYIECDNATEAYRCAYNTENMKEPTIGNNAYQLMRHNGIAAKIKDLRGAGAKKLGIDREYITKGITDTIARAIQDGDHSNTMKGYDMLGKMYDLNEDKQNDRLVSIKERQALFDNFKQRLMINVTPEGDGKENAQQVTT